MLLRSIARQRVEAAEKQNFEDYKVFALALKEHKAGMQKHKLRSSLCTGARTRWLQENAALRLKSQELKTEETKLGFKCVQRFLLALGASRDSPHKLQASNAYVRLLACVTTCLIVV